MTDEQINAAIVQVVNAGERWMIEKDYCNGDIPNYCTDLNAMHEAEKMLKEKGLVSKYEMTLGRNGGNRFNWSKIHTTARQRAEAFLRTLGKWEEAVVKESFTTENEVK
jgi:hypothetical protein